MRARSNGFCKRERSAVETGIPSTASWAACIGVEPEATHRPLENVVYRFGLRKRKGGTRERTGGHRRTQRRVACFVGTDMHRSMKRFNLRGASHSCVSGHRRVPNVGYGLASGITVALVSVSGMKAAQELASTDCAGTGRHTQRAIRAVGRMGRSIAGCRFRCCQSENERGSDRSFNSPDRNS